MPALDLPPADAATGRPGAVEGFRLWRRDPEDAIAGLVLIVVAVVSLGPVPGLLPTAALAVVTPMLWRADLTERRLPNVLVLPCAAVAALTVCASIALGGPEPLAPLVAAGATFVFFAVLCAGGGMGMGDLKLAVVLATVLALARLDAVVLAGIVAFLSGGLGGLVVLWRRGSRSIPFGPFLLVGFWTAVVLVR